MDESPLDCLIPQMKYEARGYWQGRISGFPLVAIQGDASGMDAPCLTTARRALADWGRCLTIAGRELKRMLRPDYEYHCHMAWFHDYEYGWRTRTGGFEMFFWQDQPDDDRYVNYVVQFTDACQFGFGIRIFSE